jgi:hypothetical protein
LPTKSIETTPAGGVTSSATSAPQQSPPIRKLAIASGLALLGALVALVTAVLPAEYGIDVLGTGRLLGLTALSSAGVAAVPPPQGDVLAPQHEGAVALYPGRYRVDSRSFTLGPYEYLEYKYRLQKDATMLFAWQASADVVHDFHGDRDGATTDSPESYDDRPRRQADGSFMAPFSGIHGWFWENPGADTITVHVTTAGFYTEAYEFKSDRTRQRRDVRAVDVIPTIEGSKE